MTSDVLVECGVVALLDALCLTMTVRTRRARPRRHHWLGAVVVVGVAAAAGMTGVLVAGIPFTQAAPWVMLVTLSPAILLVTARLSPATTTASNLAALSRRTAEAVRNTGVLGEGYPIDSDAVATIIRYGRLGLVSLAGGSPSGTAPMLLGYCTPRSADTISLAANRCGTAVVVIDPDETSAHATLEFAGLDPSCCYPPDVHHLWVPPGVIVGRTLAATIAHLPVVLIRLDGNSNESAYRAWGRLAAAFTSGALR